MNLGQLIDATWASDGCPAPVKTRPRGEPAFPLEIRTVRGRDSTEGGGHDSGGGGRAPGLLFKALGAISRYGDGAKVPMTPIAERSGLSLSYGGVLLRQATDRKLVLRHGSRGCYAYELTELGREALAQHEAEEGPA